MFRLFEICEQHGTMKVSSSQAWHNLSHSEQLDAAEIALARRKRRHQTAGESLLDLEAIKAKNEQKVESCTLESGP